MKAFDTTIASTLLDSKDEFPVDFDRAWKWLGFSRKDNAKQSLIGSGFVDSVDFLIIKESDNHAALSPQEKAKKSRKESIWLTIDCFKTWGMMANTEQGKQIRTYFLQCEKIAKQKAAETIAADRAMYEELASRTKALPCPEITLRSKIVRAVDNYVQLFKASHSQVWTAIYRDLKYTYHYDASARLKASGIKRSKLEQIEADNMLESLRSVAEKVLGAEI